MATPSKEEATVEEAVPGVEAPRDRVAMLSIDAQGHVVGNPILIGDEDAVRENTREQFRQFAVSAVDVKLNAEADPDNPVSAKDRQKAHDKAVAAAEKAADAAVDAHYEG